MNLVQYASSSSGGCSERVTEYADGVLEGDRALLGRAITLIESRYPADRADATRLLRRLLPHTGGACRVGITGVPGVGKSSLIEVLGCEFVSAGHKLAVLAVDPSSAIGGGSILADKTRMERLATEENAFIRPSPSSGAQGGMARSSYETMLLCEAAGFDVVLVESVGVGQLENAIADMVDILIMLALPGAGDELQGIKKGTLERADMIVITKADGIREVEAQAAMSRYREAMSILGIISSRTAPEVALYSAKTGLGNAELRRSIEAFHARLHSLCLLESRRGEQRVRRMQALLASELMAVFMKDRRMCSWLREAEAALQAGETTPFMIMDEISARLEVRLGVSGS